MGDRGDVRPLRLRWEPRFWEMFWYAIFLVLFIFWEDFRLWLYRLTKARRRPVEAVDVAQPHLPGFTVIKPSGEFTEAKADRCSFGVDTLEKACAKKTGLRVLANRTWCPEHYDLVVVTSREANVGVIKTALGGVLRA